MCANENECVILIQDSHEYTIQLNTIKPCPRVNTVRIQYNNKVMCIIIPHFLITVSDLKNLISIKLNYDNLDLYYDYIKMCDNKTLYEYDINYKSIINIYNKNTEDIIIHIF